MSPRVSPHFLLSELTVTRQVDEWGRPLPNDPGPAELLALKTLCELALERVRSIWGCPVRVTSAYRSHDVEMKVSGKDYGQHRLGQAADIVAVGPLDIVEGYEMLLNSDIPYDQLIIEQDLEGHRWIHISIAMGRDPRRMALFTRDNGKSYDFYRPGAMNDARLA